LRIITKPFKTHIFYFTLLFSSCQSEQIQWIEGLEHDKKGSNKPVYPAALDKQLAYINKYPKDTLRNITILKKTIKDAVNAEDDELAYKLFLLGLQKYPDIVRDDDFFDFINYFYTGMLKEENTAKWITGIIIDHWNEDQKTAYFSTIYKNIKEEFPKLKSYQQGEQLVNMAKIHSLIIPKGEQSALFLWKSYEIMRWMGSDLEALNLLDLILIRHENWKNIKMVKKERDLLLKNKNRLKWNGKEKINIAPYKKDQTPVS
jgi:hypothetical protein